LWKKGDAKERFWQSVLEVIGDLLIWNLPVFSTFRAWAVFLWFIGFLMLLLGIFVFYKNTALLF
jgi:hypothetical protein